VASDYKFGGPGVEKPHPRKNWVNPDAHPVFGPDAGRPRRSASPRPAAPSGPTGDRPGRSPLRLVAGLLGLIVVLVGIAYLLVVFVF